MEGLPILDYTPQTLLGIVILLILFGRLVPYTVVKQLREENAFLRSTVEKEQAAREEEQKTGRVVRHFFEGLSRGADL